jgi:hypothetical protein
MRATITAVSSQTTHAALKISTFGLRVHGLTSSLATLSYTLHLGTGSRGV